jgi:hypothetical protein
MLSFLINRFILIFIGTCLNTKNAVFWDVNLMALVRTDVSKEGSAFVIRATRIGGFGITLAVTSNRRTLRRNTSYC